MEKIGLPGENHRLTRTKGFMHEKIVAWKFHVWNNFIFMHGNFIFRCMKMKLSCMEWYFHAWNIHATIFSCMFFQTVTPSLFLIGSYGQSYLRPIWRFSFPYAIPLSDVITFVSKTRSLWIKLNKCSHLTDENLTLQEQAMINAQEINLWKIACQENWMTNRYKM